MPRTPTQGDANFFRILNKRERYPISHRGVQASHLAFKEYVDRYHLSATSFIVYLVLRLHPVDDLTSEELLQCCPRRQAPHHHGSAGYQPRCLMILPKHTGAGTTPHSLAPVLLYNVCRTRPQRLPILRQAAVLHLMSTLWSMSARVTIPPHSSNHVP